MPQKINKDRVWYRNEQYSEERCENCHFFVPGRPHLCALVDGDIHPDWSCDIMRLRDRALEGQGPGDVMPTPEPLSEEGSSEFMKDNPGDILR